jgi:hypothetical protein
MQSASPAERLLSLGHLAEASMTMAETAGDEAWIDPDIAVELLQDSLTLARRSGMPLAVASNLAFLALALSVREPERARQLLLDANPVGGTLVPITRCFAAGRLADRSLLLREASRLLHIDRRSRSVAVVHLTGILNMVALHLADTDADAAAVIHGAIVSIARAAVSPLAQQLKRPMQGTVSDEPPPISPLIEFLIRVRRNASARLRQSLGEGAVRQLRAKGETMDRDQVSDYARIHIDQQLSREANQDSPFST